MHEGFRPLNTKELKPMFKYIEDRWGVDLKGKFAFFINAKDNVFLAGKDVGNIDLSNLRVNHIGYYVWEWRHNEARPSIEGSQLIGPLAKRNILKLNDGLFKLWIAGYDLQFRYAEDGFVLMQHNDDFVGCGRSVDGKILNFVPKARRLILDDTSESSDDREVEERAEETDLE